MNSDGRDTARLIMREEIMTEEQYRSANGIPHAHRFVQVKSENKQGKGVDTDTTWYNEVDADGSIVDRHVQKETMSMYPPFSQSESWTKE